MNVSAQTHLKMSRLAVPFRLLGILALTFGLQSAHGQTSFAYDIRPTVTASMGDVGGKYFGRSPDPAKTRHYYIAAEPVQWDFMPLGSDPICGMTPPPNLRTSHAARKARYFQYTDGTFTQRVPQQPRLGILGPVLRGVVGEYIEITFLNRTGLPLSMHPHGVKYDKDSEGSYYGNNGQPAAPNKESRFTPGLGSAIGPNAKFTYVWYCDSESGPMPSESSSKGWLYHSHVSGEGEVNLGLEGMIIVTDAKRARPDGTPNDVDREMPALFMIFNEGEVDPEAYERLGGTPGQSVSNLINSLPGLPGQKISAAKDASLAAKEEGERYAINGFIYGNLPALEMNEDERVRWYLFDLGSESDLHTPHWHGLRVIDEGKRRTDTMELLPASMKVADMVPDNPGDWLFHCHVAEHMAGGMFARVTVFPKDKPNASTSPEKAFLGFPLPTAGERSDKTK
jgi:FtsP/CotA-like multicopper oxidase with cupredoxin domain